MFTPNEKYAALVAAGYVRVALSGEDYVELLPALDLCRVAGRVCHPCHEAIHDRQPTTNAA